MPGESRQPSLAGADYLRARGSRRYQAELLFAVQNPCALGHEAVLARDPDVVGPEDFHAAQQVRVDLVPGVGRLRWGLE
jgi:hypothetical protein